MTHNRWLPIAVALASLALAGCDKQVAEGTKATGEVLEGTVSDAMIATDEVRSEPPLAPHTPKETDSTGATPKGKVAHGDEADAPPASEASPTAEAAPAAKPSPSEPAG